MNGEPDCIKLLGQHRRGEAFESRLIGLMDVTEAPDPAWVRTGEHLGINRDLVVPCPESCSSS